MKSLVRDEVLKAIEGLRCGFSWDESEEGFEFWDSVSEKLVRYLDQISKSKDLNMNIRRKRKS